MLGHGCASGLAGTQNSSTAEAPIGMMNHGTTAPSTWRLIHSVQPSPTATPSVPSAISRRPADKAAGRENSLLRDIGRLRSRAGSARRNTPCGDRNRSHTITSIRAQKARNECSGLLGIPGGC